MLQMGAVQDGYVRRYYTLNLSDPYWKHKVGNSKKYTPHDTSQLMIVEQNTDNYTQQFIPGGVKMLFSLNITQLTLIKSLYKDTLHRQSPWALFRNHLEWALHTNRCSTVMSPGVNPIHYLTGRCSHGNRAWWHLAKTEDMSVLESHSAFGSGHSETRNGYGLPGLLGGEVL